MKSILVTGGAGFVGSHVCEKLVNQQHKVICLDNLQTGNLQNIKHLMQHPNFRFIEHDIEEPIDVDVNEIYNLACPASPPNYQKDAVKTIKTSVLGAINVLELAKRYGASVLQASTSEVYGNPKEHPQHESYWGNVNPIGERSCYDEGKRCAESLFINYYKQYQVPVKIVRIFNTYGPYMDINDGRVVSNFITQALQNKPITIYGEGKQTRSFQYISDLVEGLTRMMQTPKSCIGPVNIGNPNEFTVLELAKLVITLVQSSSEIVFLPLPKDDPTQRKPDIKQAHECLNGWQPQVPLKDGLIQTIAYFKEQLNSRS